MKYTDWQKHIDQLIARNHKTKGHWQKQSELSWDTKPTKGWSPIEVLEHMNLSLEIYTPKLLQKQTSLQNTTPENFIAGWTGQLFINTLTPSPNQKNVKTFAVFEPSPQNQNDLNKEWDRFEKNFATLEQFWKENKDKNLNGKRVSSALGPILMFRMGSVMEFLLWHNLRHFEQIERTMQAIKA